MDQPESFFGDGTRKVRTGNTTEYLIWHTPHLREFEMVLYSKDPSIDDIVTISMSSDQRIWEQLAFTIDHVNTSPSGWHQLILRGDPNATFEPEFFRLTLEEATDMMDVQLGRVVFRLLKK